MNHSIFYTSLAEWSKVLFDVLLMIFVFIGLWKKAAKRDPHWENWIHLAVFAHFFVGAFYSGIRMLTTDEIADMLIRRIFACEAWFNFACAAFYFLFQRYISVIKKIKLEPI